MYALNKVNFISASMKDNAVGVEFVSLTAERNAE